MQNRSTAVMNRRAEPHDSLDFFPTPPWATRALCGWLDRRCQLDVRTVWEPACGAGDMARPLGEFFQDVLASDVHDYGFGRVDDFLLPGARGWAGRPQWIITNPPFRLAEEFVARACEAAEEGVAVLVRTSFLESVGRYRDLFSRNPPSWVLQFTERVPMHKGRLTATGSTATAYCWLVWIKGEPGVRFDWLGPCRKQLERPGDYPDFAQGEQP